MSKKPNEQPITMPAMAPPARWRRPRLRSSVETAASGGSAGDCAGGCELEARHGRRGLPHNGMPRKDVAGMPLKLVGISPVRLLKETFKEVSDGMLTFGSSPVRRLPFR
uniref:Uncharacterized protein n=1 Tax=Arundo donax TaxID=35708 RepID=A0A0A9F3B0_ARUDO